MDHPYSYTLFGLTIGSGMELPELQRAEHGEADVEIGYRDLDPAEPVAAELTVTVDGALLQVPRVGRYLVERGCRISVDPDDDASPRSVRLFLLGSAFGALLHQRGLLPLHANAVAIDGRAVAFTGASGAGKSTLASLFHDRGHHLLSDDVCVVDVDAVGRAIAYAGIPQVRLWRDSLERSGRSAGDFEQLLDGRDKYTVPARGEGAPAAIALGAIYVLKRAEDDIDRIDIRQLRGAEALNALIANTYRGRYIALLGDMERYWARGLDLVGKVPIFELERPWDPDRLPATIDAVEAHLRSIA
ncbi:MAG: hypothetical protein JWN66_3330 [Sphingomonas bacterium]|nr:hypothetical protein [Sphingomonas bacterium]